MVKEINVIGRFAPPLEQKFNADVKELKSGDVAVLNITSEGGNVDTLISMTKTVLALKESGVKFISYIPEYANSSGFFFYLLGDERDMAETASAHYHPPRVQFSQGDFATRDDMMEMADGLAKSQEFTNGLFRAAVEIDDELFSLLENSELPMRRPHLVSLGIINP